MPDDPSQEYRRLAVNCLGLAQKASDPQTRAFLIMMSQKWLEQAEKWLEQAERAERNDSTHSLRRRVIRDAIVEQLSALYRPSSSLPPHILALLAGPNAESDQNGD
jgi:hypothetical protein